MVVCLNDELHSVLLVQGLDVNFWLQPSVNYEIKLIQGVREMIPGSGRLLIYNLETIGNIAIMISISKKAKDILSKQIGNNEFVRITVKSGGCAGMTYDANIVSEKDEDEKIVYREGEISVITDDTSLPYLHGLDLDYSDDLISAGFRFNNSSNESSCGCGSSFSATSGFPQFMAEGVGCGS